MKYNEQNQRGQPGAPVQLSFQSFQRFCHTVLPMIQEGKTF